MADNPITREEQYLAYLNRQGTAIPYPITRTEQFLYELCMNGGLGGGTSINILGELASTSELPSTDAEKGDAYIINGELWVYSGSTLSSAVNGFSNCGRFTAGNDGQDGKDGEDGTDGFSPTVTENPSNTPNNYRLDITTISGTFTTPNLIGAQGQQGIQGERGEQGETGLQGQQGIQGVKGEKGDDGYPFLIYKQYEVGIEEFNEADFPEIGLMFMIHVFEEDKGYPVYRYTADGTDTPYSLVTYMNTEGIKGEKGDKGEDGAQGIAGLDGKDGKDGTTYTPSIGEVTTVESDIEASASVSIKEETKEAVFNFAIPKGNKGLDGVQISDNETVEDKTWSSKKTSDEIAKVETELGEKVDYKVVVEDGNRYVEDIVVQEINTWLPNDNSSILINLKKTNGITYLNFQLLCNKKDSKNWSCIVNGAANELWKIRYIDGVRYIDELATMDKVNALHKETTGFITGSLLGSVVKDANLYYQKFGDNRLVINGWVSVDAVSARTPIFTLPNNWKANSNYLLPCYVIDSNVACACVIDIEKGTVNSYTPLPATLELRFCGEIYLM